MKTKELATMTKTKPILEKPTERRSKSRFSMQRELRYKVLRDHRVIETGTSNSVNIGSGGVAFHLDHELAPGCLVELSIGWPVLLDNCCAMRLVTYGRLLRSRAGLCACSIDKYEFRTQARVMQTLPVRTDTVFQRWAETVRREKSRLSVARASAS
jgi:hypothetical protein